MGSHKFIILGPWELSFKTGKIIRYTIATDRRIFPKMSQWVVVVACAQSFNSICFKFSDSEIFDRYDWLIILQYC